MKIGLLKVALISLLCSCVMVSCGRQDKQPPVDLTPKEQVQETVDVSYAQIGKIKTIPVKVNGVSMDMIFDSGCSGVTMSLHEVQTLAKNGQISQSDIIGSSYSTIADGSIVENGLILLREIEIGGPNGVVLHNIEASVLLNQEAPVLLGNDVLDRVASYEVDNKEKTIRFKLK